MGKFKTAFQIYLPEDLGIIGDIWAHIRILNEDNTELEPVKVTHVKSYISGTGSEWLKVINSYTGEAIQYSTMKSSVFLFPITIYDYMKGEFYVTFTAWKNENLTSYYTLPKKFEKNQKLIIW